MERWSGRVAVVTGASEGIGEAIVRRLAARGMRVVALARRKALLEALENDVNKSGKDKVRGIVCDVSSRSDVAAVFEKIAAEVGPVSVLVNNAGVLFPIPLSDMNLDNTDSVLDINMKGVLYCTKAALDSMKKNNITDGHIINISSLIAHLDTDTFPEYGVYGASKSGLNVLTKSLKYQLAKEKSKIKISTVSPGLVATTMTEDLLPKLQGMGCLVAADIADAVEYVIATPPHVNIREVIVEPT